jgi:hypothetical protein
MIDELTRMRRHLRAMSATNRQLQAQLEGSGIRAVALPGSARAATSASDVLAADDQPGRSEPAAEARRAGRARTLIEQLELQGNAGEPALVRRGNGALYIVEAGRKREIKSGILGATIERDFGQARDVTDDELEQLPDGVPVDIFEGPTGSAFVIYGGQRRPLRGLPLPYPLSERQTQLFPEGEELNVSAANIARSRFEQASSAGYQVQRARAALAAKGTVATTRTAAKRVARKAKRTLRGKTT